MCRKAELADNYVNGCAVMVSVGCNAGIRGVQRVRIGNCGGFATMLSRGIGT
jgi:hypothetical protein